MTNLTTWLAEQRALCDAATPGPWYAFAPSTLYHGDQALFVEPFADAQHVAAWSPDHARRVLNVVEAASEALKCVEWSAGLWGEPPVPCVRLSRERFNEMRAALAALEAP